MRQLIVTAGVIVEDGRVLITQRRDDDREGGKWEFPGGKVELGEDPRQAMRRELQEELGIKVSVGRPLDVISITSGNMQLILLYFACRIIAGTPRTIECQQWLWGSPEQVDGLEKPAADTRFWGRFREMDFENI